MSLERTPRLLVADDDPGVITAYRLVLGKSDESENARELFGLDTLEAELFGVQGDVKPKWRVTFVEQGLDAVNAIKWALDDGDPFAGIFLDVRMPPGIDGYETAKRIRLIDPSVHIVIVSGYSDYTLEQFLEVAGPEHLLTVMPKPLWPDQMRKVATILAREAKHHRVQLNPLRKTE
jgi:CheY-like chemotaxis protein